MSLCFTQQEEPPSKEAEDDGEDKISEQEKANDLEERMEELFEAVALAKDGERIISEMFKILPSRDVR